MFTGLIERIGTVTDLRRSADGAVLGVACDFPRSGYRLGESIAVNGACLTVVDFDDSGFKVDVSNETLQVTTLGSFQRGRRVNLERALRFGDRLGGHLVSGHIDAVAAVASRQQDGRAVRFSFTLASDAARYLAAKGSVAIDGISLTVNSVGPETFSVSIIPHTMAETTLAGLTVGERVNIETDLIARYVERLLGGREENGRTPSISRELLAKHGFL